MASPLAATAPNYSIFAIPAYFILSICPHLYSNSLLKTKKGSTKAKTEQTTAATTATTSSPGTAGKDQSKTKNLYNKANPRSSQNADFYSSSLDPEVFARYERSRAAHTNMLENSGFVISAILAGVVAKCDAAYMNKMVLAYLATRVAYTLTYVNVSRGPWALMRTFWFICGNGVLFAIWIAAGKKVMYGNY